MENDKCKMLWDFTVQTDYEIYGRRPDVIVVQKILHSLMMEEWILQN